MTQFDKNTIETISKYINPQLLAYIFIILSGVTWIFGFIFVSQNNFSPHQFTLGRFTFQIFLAYIHCKYSKSKFQFRNTYDIASLMMRNILLFGHSVVCAAIQFYLPQNISNTILAMTPIIVFVQNYFIFKVEITKRQIIGCIIGFIGLILIINSRLLYEYFNQDYSFESYFQNYKTSSSIGMFIASVLFIIWISIWCLTIVFTKSLNFDTAELIFTQAATSIVLQGFIYPFISTKPLEIYLKGIIFSGILLTFSNYFFTFGIVLTKNVGLTSMNNFFIIVFSNLISIYRYNQPINLLAIIGSVIVILSICLVLILKESTQKDKNCLQKQKQQIQLTEKQFQKSHKK